MQTTVKTIFIVKGNVLGDVFETDNGYGLHHIDTNTTQYDFTDFDSALNELHGLIDDYLESR